MVSFHSSITLRFIVFLFEFVSISWTYCLFCSGNSGYVVVSIFINFPSNSNRAPPFHNTAIDCSQADYESSWLFNKCSMGGYHWSRFFCCYGCWILRMGPSWNWCKYSSLQISGQVSFVSMILNCLPCCCSWKKSFLSFFANRIMLI